jgi:hypothetical protein
MDRIEIQEAIQAGDTFLIRFNCVYCGSSNLNGWKNLVCSHCKKLVGMFFEFEGSKNKFRCIAGTKRKAIRFRKKTIKTLIEIQNDCCAYCDKPLENFHVDHIVPLAFGGSNNSGNLVLACKYCNLKAGSKVFQSFLDKRDWIRASRKIDQTIKTLN